MLHNYPLLLDVTDRQIVIVGGGEVAVRKVLGLLAAGARRVRVVSPEFHERMPGEIERITAAYRREHLTGAQMVFAATHDPSINDAIVRDAHEMGLLVCRADTDDENSGDFATPAMIRKDPVLVTVSTGGSPALAARLRDAIEQVMNPRWIEMARLMQTLRPQIRARASLAPARRKEVFRTLASDEALDVLEKNGADGLQMWLIERYPELSKRGAQPRGA